MATVVLYACIILGLLVCALCVALAIVAIRLTLQLRSLSQSIEHTEQKVNDRLQYVQVATIALGVIRQLVRKIPAVNYGTKKSTDHKKQSTRKLWQKK